MLENIRAFMIVTEEGSLHRAARRLHLSQSALSRQMQKLEHEVGGALLERASTGVRPTEAGRELAARMVRVLSDYEAALVAARRSLRGEAEQLRVGYIGSGARDYLFPAIAQFRKRQPKVKLRLLDLSPGESMAGLRRGEIDAAIIHEGEEILAVDYYVRRLATVRGIAALPHDHRLASRPDIRLAELKGETFMKPLEADVPGYGQKLTRQCRKLGGFKPKLVGQSRSLAEGLELVANDGVVALLPAFPEFMRNQCQPVLHFVRIRDPEVTWDVSLVWKRGLAGRALRGLLDAITENAKQPARVTHS